MIISIASGKGGTGKTTVSTNLARSIGNVQFFDCDVEEPNANIFLKIPLTRKKEVTMSIPEIDTKKCDFCGKCAEFCAYNALAVVKSHVLLFPELCHACGGCELVCPKNAIYWNKRTIGLIENGRKDDIELFHGLLNIGESQAVPIIKELKKNIDRNKTVIIDVPPGTSCPVIESVKGSDHCILVTEPTPFGLHDLQLAVEVLRHIKIPFGVIINRERNEDQRVEQFCHKESIPILLKIPEKKDIAYLYSKGKMLADEDPTWKEQFNQVYHTIHNEVDP